MVNSVAIAGATGNIGVPVVQQLVAANFKVMVLSRSDNPPGLPASITVRKVNYDSVESLTAALQGIEAVVSTMGAAATLGQKKLIDAAVAAGVKRFLPSEFGPDFEHPEVRAVAVFKPKLEVQEHLKKVSAESDLTYTFLATGAFLDWGIRVRYLIGNPKERKAGLLDGGDVAFSATTVPTIGRAVISVLRHLEETKNRTVYVQEALVTQNQLLRFAKELTPGAEWAVTRISTAELKAKADAKIAKGIFDADVATSLVQYAVWGKVPAFKKLDNELLGIRSLSDEEIRAIVETAL